MDGERIAKFLSRAGIASRREAERMIAAGRIQVNGKTIETPALGVTEQDTISLDNEPIAKKQPTRLWRYHKAAGLMTTHSDPQGRKTIFDALPKSLPRLISIGRLDYNTEGLLLLTNNGELKRHLELPKTGWRRRYRVRAFGKTSDEKLKKLEQGVLLDGRKTAPIFAKIESGKSSNLWISVTLSEGRNREVRRVLEMQGLQINRLIRISFGPIALGKLSKGTCQEISRRQMKDHLGKDWFA